MKKKIIVMLFIAMFLVGANNVEAKKAKSNTKKVTKKKKKKKKVQYVKMKNKKNLKYNNVSARQKLDVYYPKKIKKNNDNPVVIYFHGGAYNSGGKTNNLNKNKAKFNKAGFVYVPIGYRLLSEKPYPAAADDAKTAVRYLKHNRKKLKINPNKIVVLGYSAGANLGSLTATTQNVKKFGNERYLYPKVNNRVAGFMGVSGFYDYDTLYKPYDEDDWMPYSIATINRYLGVGNDVLYMKNRSQGNTIKYSKNMKTPVMLMYGTKDIVIPVTQSRQYCGQLRKTNKKVYCYEYRNNGHGYNEYTKDLDYKRMIWFARSVTK